MANHLIAPHGGTLINLVVADKSKKELKTSQNWPSWDLSPRQMCDLELLLNGAFSPLSGFMVKSDYESVCSSMRLQDGTVWPIPIVLDVSEDIAKRIDIGNKLVLRDPEGLMLAVLTVKEVWKPDRLAEAEAVYSTINTEHSGVAYLLENSNSCYIRRTC